LKGVISALKRIGEDFEELDNEVRVKLSWLLGNLIIKTDISKNKPQYSYQQTPDILFAMVFVALSVIFLGEQSYYGAALMLSLGLFRFVACILKEVRVTMIKGEIARDSIEESSTYNKTLKSDS